MDMQAEGGKVVTGRARTPPVAVAFQLALSVPLLGLVAWSIASQPKTYLHPQLFLWAALLAGVELVPVPAWKGLNLSLGFPIRLGVAILYPPMVAATVALIGSFDPRELTRSRKFLATIFDRCQIALSVLAGGFVFRQLATVHSRWFILLPAVFLTTVVTYLVNVALVAIYMRLTLGVDMREVLSKLRVGALTEFLLSYLGLSLAGAMIARLYLEVQMWAVAVFVLPLVFARQMFFRTKALEEAHRSLQDRERVLRALSNRMAEERHDERMQIAGYLHDDLAQMLFRLTLQVDMAKKRLAMSDVRGVEKDLDGINTTKQQASDMVRALIRDLHRSPIGRAGLAEALTSFAQDAQSRFDTPVVVDVHEPSLPPPIQLLIYQIAREAAMNALKHAEASTIWITLNEVPDGVDLEIRDDGKGFDTDAPPPEGHFGSVMMRERALVAGGTFVVQSELGSGSSVRARFPLVWVEEGSLHDEEGRTTAASPPVGSSTALPATPLNPPPPYPRGIRFLRKGRRGGSPSTNGGSGKSTEDSDSDKEPEAVPH